MGRIFIIGIDTIDDVTTIREQVLETIRNGGSMATGWSAEGISVTRTQGLPLWRILEECNLFLLESTGRRVTRTSPGYLL